MILDCGYESSNCDRRQMVGKRMKCLPTLLSGKAFVVFERLGDDKEDDFKVLVTIRWSTLAGRSS